MARAGAPTAVPSISPTPTQREIWAYDYDTANRRGGQPPRLLLLSRRRASRACRTARPSTPKASSGACRFMRASSPASRPTAARPRRRPSCRKHDQPELRRPRSRRRLCHLDGARREGREPERARGGRLSLPSTASACEGCPNRASRDEDNPLRDENEEELMRIEVLIDVKAVLGEGPLWDVDEQRLYFIDSFGCNVFRCTADGGRFALGTCRRRSARWLCADGAARCCRSPTGSTFSISRPASPAHRGPGARQARTTGSTTARWTSAAASSRARWIRWRKGRTARSTASTPISRYTSWTSISSSPTVRAGVPTGASSISPTAGRAKSGRTTTTSTRAPSPTSARSPNRSLARRRGRRLHGRRGRMPLERAGL